MLVEGTLRVNYERLDKKKTRKALVELYLAFLEHLDDEDTQPELTVTANFLLSSVDERGRETFSVWFGTDFTYSDRGTETVLGKPFSVTGAQDLSGIVDRREDEDRACAALELNLPEGSNVQVLGIINLVYVLRAVGRGPEILKRGRQIELH